MRHKTALLYLLSIVSGLLLWELIAAQFSRVVLSPPTAVARHLYVHIRSLELPLLLVRSSGHTLLGYALAVAVALPLLFLMGRGEKDSPVLTSPATAVARLKAILTGAAGKCLGIGDASVGFRRTGTL